MFEARPVEGAFRRLRWAADGILIAILLVVPWIEIGGEPLVRLDVPARQFHVFGLVIFPQELYFLWLIVAALALSLFFFTALAGRLWCGWACPQTVLTDVYAALARRIEGWTRTGPPSRVAPWRRIAKHAVFLALSLVLGFHLVSYFVGPRELLAALRAGSATRTELGFLAAATGLAFFDLVILRQTFCKYLCPYARLQSVLFDRDTLVVAYDALRGEPRGKVDKRAGAARVGDCTDCGLCVAVCPTGIDIRKGQQLECIACTQCIDACNGVMEKLGRAPDLIGYRSLVGLERERPVRILRPRVVIYGALLATVATAFVAALSLRLPLDLTVAHNATALFGAAADGRPANAFVLHIQNRDRTDHVYRIELEGPDGYELVAGENPVPVPATASREARVFVLRGREDGGEEHPVWAGAARLRFVIEELGDPRRTVGREAYFVSRGDAGGGTGGR
ncbi:MAG TPA: cytochrome c oxidase accessory protein CcoG [Myxococcota bacterium]|jgi:cytochrome c oxidase accessory protein FixG|nr:cytochrome c oxidase accessory protein CcoG [Myxococcota bacterium]